MSDVYLYMYDISKGMAKALSPMLLGQELEALWHTSVVVYGNEYLFAGGAGILEETPESTSFGVPMYKRLLGTTRKTSLEFRNWNRGQRDAFGADSYNLLEKNCNHYSDEALKFLINEGVPATVSEMTQTILSSPLGRVAAQFIEPMMQQQAQMSGAAGRTAGGSAGSSGGGATSGSSDPFANAGPGRTTGTRALDGSDGTSAPTSLLGANTPANPPPQAAVPAAPKYFCHLCDAEVEVKGEEPFVCVTCNGEFIEVLDTGAALAAAEQPAVPADPAADPMAPLLAMMQAAMGPGANGQPSPLAALLGNAGVAGGGTGGPSGATAPAPNAGNSSLD